MRMHEAKFPVERWEECLGQPECRGLEHAEFVPAPPTDDAATTAEVVSRAASARLEKKEPR